MLWFFLRVRTDGWSRLRERNAYRYAGVTMAIVMLVPAHSGWVVALHRFFEVSSELRQAW